MSKTPTMIDSQRGIPGPPINQLHGEGASGVSIGDENTSKSNETTSFFILLDFFN